MDRTEQNKDKPSRIESQQKPPSGITDTERLDRIERRRRLGFIYFVRCENFVKIGYSENPRYRPLTFRTGNPFDCSLIGIVEGGLDDEKRIHQQFRDDHHRDEWFHLTPNVGERISAICGDWSEKAVPTTSAPKITRELFDLSHLVD